MCKEEVFLVNWEEIKKGFNTFYDYKIWKNSFSWYKSIYPTMLEQLYNTFFEVLWGHLKYNTKKIFDLAIANIYSTAMQLLHVLCYYFMSVFIHVIYWYTYVCFLIIFHFIFLIIAKLPKKLDLSF